MGVMIGLAGFSFLFSAPAKILIPRIHTIRARTMINLATHTGKNAGPKGSK